MTLRIGFVATCEPNDRKYWSGTVYHMRRGLEAAGAHVTHVGPFFDSFARRNSFLNVATGLLGRKKVLSDRNENTLIGYANQLKTREVENRYDVLVSPSTLPLSKFQSSLPKFVWIDASFGSMIDFYPEFTNLSGPCILQGHRIEQESLTSARMVVFASQWAQQEAIEIYNLDKRRTAVIPFGANIATPPDSGFLRQSIEQKGREQCVLLFIGVDWQRKGGTVALAVADYLNSTGLKTTLHIVGAEVPARFRRPYVFEHGYVDKNSPAGYSKMIDLFGQAHFLILPTKAECFGIVLAEASAFGVPSLAYNVGGVGSAVSDDVSGKLFPLSEGSSTFAEFIRSKFDDWESYVEMALRSRQNYLNRTNWTTAGCAILELIRDAR